MMIGAVLAGLYLSRHAAECFKERVDEFNLAGVIDDGSSTGLVGEGGVVQKGTKGDYAENFTEGSGFFGFLGRSIPYCAEKESFRDPIYVFYAFWGLLVIGGLFLGLDKLITPTWKKEIKRKSKEDAEEERRREQVHDDIGRTREAGRRAQREKKIEAIAIEAHDEGGVDVSNLLMHNDDFRESGPSKPSKRPAGRKPLPDGLDETPKRARKMSQEKRDELSALGLDAGGGLSGVNTDWMDEEEEEERPRGRSLRRGPASDSGLMQVTKSGDEDVAESGSARNRARRPVRVVAAQVHTGDEEPGLATSIQDGAAPPSSNILEDRSKVWLPLGRVEDPFIYVVPAEEAEGPGLRDGTRINRAVGGIGAGLEAAREHLDAGRTVQLRLMPGVYREQIELPSGVALINHHIPRNLSTDEQRFWLTGSEENDHAQHVVLALPPEAPEDARVLSAEGASGIIVAGVHIAGRSELEEEGTLAGGGIRLLSTTDSTIFLCHFIGHRLVGDGAALSLNGCGAEIQERVLLQDCLMEFNASSGHGGAIYAEGSALVMRGCALQANKAGLAGGAIYACGSGVPLLLEDCNLTENDVHRPGELPSSSRGGWRGTVGHGGGIYIDAGMLHLRRCDLTENKAQGSGGGIYASGSRVLIEGAEDPAGKPSRITGNVGLRGGGVLMAGTASSDPEALTALKATNTEFIANVAKESGGGLATFCLVQVDLTGCGLMQNKVEAEHGEGGGLHANLGSRVKLTETRVDRNSVVFRGSGLSICNSSLRVFKGCSVTANTTSGGDAAVAFYTMDSDLLPDLQTQGLLEDPVVCAMGPCVIRENHARKGVGGLFIGNYTKTATNPIAFALKAPELIEQNTIQGADGAPVTRDEVNNHRPVDLMIVWKGSIRSDDGKPPAGKRVLK